MHNLCAEKDKLEPSDIMSYEVSHSEENCQKLLRD